MVTGTPVSAEVFFAWKKKFDAEMNARRAKERGIKLEEKKRKLTGETRMRRSWRRRSADSW